MMLATTMTSRYAKTPRGMHIQSLYSRCIVDLFALSATRAIFRRYTAAAAAAVNTAPAAGIRFSAGDGPVVNFLNI